MGHLPHMQTLLPLLSCCFPQSFFRSSALKNVSHENDLIFMRMNEHLVLHKDSCYKGKSQLGIGLLIQELAQEPLTLIFVGCQIFFLAFVSCQLTPVRPS